MKRGCKKSQRLIARVGCGNMEEYNRYWLNKEDRKCRLCERECNNGVNVGKSRS